MQMTARIGALGDAVPRIHPQAWLAPGAILVGRVSVGRGSSVWYGSVLRADEDEIVVGEDCNIQDLCCIHVDPGEPAVIEDRVTVGHRATIHGAHVEAGALIGIGSVVLGGARIGAGALIAAGAVVLSGAVIPPEVLVAGVPGRVVRELTEADQESFRQSPDRYLARMAAHREATWQDPG